MAVFLARGFRRDHFIHQIVFQDSDLEFFPLDISSQEYNEELLIFSDVLSRFMSTVDNFLFSNAPRWFWSKDFGSWFFVRSKQQTLGQDIYVVDTDIWIFDGSFIWCWLLPWIFFIQIIRLNYGLVGWPVNSAMRHDLWVYFKIFILNNSTILGVWVHEFSVGSWSNFILSRNVPSAPGSNFYKEILPFVYWEHIDPLSTYV